MDLKLFFLFFIGTFLLSLFLTLIIKKIAIYFKIIDVPIGGRKIHRLPTPLIGGLAVYLSFILIIIFFGFKLNEFNVMPVKYLYGISLAGLVIIIGGILDDKYNLRAKYQWIAPCVASLIIISSGIGIDFISNPIGEALRLDGWKINIITLNGITYKFTVLADLFTFIWLMGMAYTTKFLDGLDGLVSGMGLIAAVIIFSISLLPEVNQTSTAILAISFGGACLGFLFWNWHPAKIFLGEGGSIFIGFMLGVLSIISGGKIATALIVMGLPIFDVLWVIGRRLLIEKKSIFDADKKHLHFRLLDLGWSVRKSVGFYLILSAIFGALTIILRGRDKILLIFILLIVMICIASMSMKKYSKIV